MIWIFLNGYFTNRLGFRARPACWDRVDMDYVHELDPKAFKFLRAFVGHFYGCDLRNAKKLSPSLRRQIYNEHNACARDFYNKRERVDIDHERFEKLVPSKLKEIRIRPKRTKPVPRVVKVYWENGVCIRRFA
ncbi:MAG: hypothetical protein AB7G93_15260 [Bdellovibrionales bacterium]